MTTNGDEARKRFGTGVNILGFSDWVGGRFSVWSAAGFSLMCAIGRKHFEELLKGAKAMDGHFAEASLEQNAPIILALLALWNSSASLRGGKAAASHAVLPYEDALARFPAYLQQLEMESNGKHTTRSGSLLIGKGGGNSTGSSYETCPVIWGEPGTNGQHAFYQMLHQGTFTVSADFIIFAQSPSEHPLLLETSRRHHHSLLVANCLAQAEALWYGQRSPASPHQDFAGGQPSTLMLLSGSLDPYALGQLVALYEHKVAALGFLLNINSFDQMGVELGKRLAKDIHGELVDRNAPVKRDATSRAAIDFFRSSSS